MTLAITGTYAALLGVLMIILKFRVIMVRGQTGISINYSDNKTLALRIRQHGNFIENVPLALLLMAIIEVQGATSGWLHAVGAMLLIGRILHPFGLFNDKPISIPRFVGTTLTTIAILICAGLILLPVISG